MENQKHAHGKPKTRTHTKKDIIRMKTTGMALRRVYTVFIRRRVCWPPEIAFFGGGPEGWECGLRLSRSSPPPPWEAVYSSSWLWPYCSRRSRSIFAARKSHFRFYPPKREMKSEGSTYKLTPFWSLFRSRSDPPGLVPRWGYRAFSLTSSAFSGLTTVSCISYIGR